MKLDIEFAFEGFRILRKQPWAVLAWGVVLLVANIIGLGSFVPLAVPAIQQLTTLSATPDPAMVAGIMAGMILPYVVLIVVMIVATAIVSCAVFRVVLGHPKRGFGYIQLGADEFRLILVHILFSFVFMGIYLACGLAGGLVGGILAVLLNAINEDLAPLGVVVGVLLVVIGLVWFMLRLSLFSVQSFDEKRINLFGSWALTRGKGWPLLGGYLLAYILAIAAETVIMMFVWMIGGIVLFANMGALQNLTTGGATPDVGAVVGAVAPIFVVFVALFSLFVQPLMMAIMVGAPAAAYRALSGRHPEAAEKIF